MAVRCNNWKENHVHGKKWSKTEGNGGKINHIWYGLVL